MLSSDVATEVDLLYKTRKMFADNNAERRTSQFIRLVEKYFSHISIMKQFTNPNYSSPNINTYLNRVGFQMSDIIINEFFEKSLISSNNIIPLNSRLRLFMLVSLGCFVFCLVVQLLLLLFCIC